MVRSGSSLHLMQKVGGPSCPRCWGLCSTCTRHTPPRRLPAANVCGGRAGKPSGPFIGAQRGALLRRDRFRKGQRLPVANSLSPLSQTERPGGVQTHPLDGCGDAVVPPGVSVAPLERAASIQMPMASLREYAYRSAPALARSSSALFPCLSCPHSPASDFAWGRRRRSRRIE